MVRLVLLIEIDLSATILTISISYNLHEIKGKLGWSDKSTRNIVDFIKWCVVLIIINEFPLQEFGAGDIEINSANYALPKTWNGKWHKFTD